MAKKSGCSQRCRVCNKFLPKYLHRKRRNGVHIGECDYLDGIFEEEQERLTAKERVEDYLEAVTGLTGRQAREVYEANIAP